MNGTPCRILSAKVVTDFSRHDAVNQCRIDLVSTQISAERSLLPFSIVSPTKVAHYFDQLVAAEDFLAVEFIRASKLTDLPAIEIHPPSSEMDNFGEKLNQLGELVELCGGHLRPRPELTNPNG